MLRRILGSFNHAINGIMHCFRTQLNMRVHFFTAILVIMLGVLLGINKNEMLILVLVIFFVLFAEMVNTAIESIVDMVTKEHHPLAKTAKNIGAGAVLLSAICSLIVGYLIFFDKLIKFSSFSINYVSNLPIYITFASLIVVFLTVIMIKSGNQRQESYLRGGLPSGHTALAFALCTSVILISNEPMTATFALIMATLVAESRMESGIHSFLEVLLGAIVGVILTIVMYQVSTLLFI